MKLLRNIADMVRRLYRLWKYRKFGNPRAYGALGDGHHDDTRAIQACINENQRVYISAGVYIVSESLWVGPGKIIVGEPGQAVVRNRWAMQND